MINNERNKNALSLTKKYRKRRKKYWEKKGKKIFQLRISSSISSLD